MREKRASVDGELRTLSKENLIVIKLVVITRGTKGKSVASEARDSRKVDVSVCHLKLVGIGIRSSIGDAVEGKGRLGTGVVGTLSTNGNAIPKLGERSETIAVGISLGGGDHVEDGGEGEDGGKGDGVLRGAIGDELAGGLNDEGGEGRGVGDLEGVGIDDGSGEDGESGARLDMDLVHEDVGVVRGPGGIGGDVGGDIDDLVGVALWKGILTRDFINRVVGL